MPEQNRVQMRGGGVLFIEGRARRARHHGAWRVMMARLACACHVAFLSIHASSSSNLPRFPCASLFLTRFSRAVLGLFRNSKWVMQHIVEKLSTSSFQRYKFARIGVRTRELWLPEVGVSELFSCAFPMKILVKWGMLLANREFHVVARVVIFPTHLGPRINLLRAGKNLRAKAAVREEKRVLLPARFFSNLVPVRACI